MIDTRKALDMLADERLRQTALHGKQDLPWPVWMSLIAEELGEASKVANDLHFQDKPARLIDLREELIQVAALAIQVVEAIGMLPGDRQERPDWDPFWMRIAKDAATRATCPRASVGCVIVDRHQRVISIGYNGAPAGEAHCTDIGCDMRDRNGRPSCHRSEHAEANAVRWADEARRSCGGATAYVTLRHCSRCMTALGGYGVARVVYLGDYPDEETITIAALTGVRLQRLEA